MSPLVLALLATFLVSSIAFVGLFLTGKLWNQRLEMRLVSFAAGVLLATAFLDLLPEALEQVEVSSVMIAALAAICGFFLLERLVHGRHTHSGHESHLGHHSTSGYFILVGDGIHNFVDGVAIAASFIISPEAGIVTTIAVLAHELPHEVGDYAVLRKSGFSRSRALWYNFLSGLTAVAGAGITFIFQDAVTENLGILIAAVAGMFIYIAAVNLIPELHHQRIKGRLLYATPFILGVILIPLLLTVLPHGHAEADSHTNEAVTESVSDSDHQ